MLLLICLLLLFSFVACVIAVCFICVLVLLPFVFAVFVCFFPVLVPLFLLFVLFACVSMIGSCCCFVFCFIRLCLLFARLLVFKSKIGLFVVPGLPWLVFVHVLVFLCCYFVVFVPLIVL